MTARQRQGKPWKDLGEFVCMHDRQCLSHEKDIMYQCERAATFLRRGCGWANHCLNALRYYASGGVARPFPSHPHIRFMEMAMKAPRPPPRRQKGCLAAMVEGI